MGHSCGLLSSWDIPMVYLLHGAFLWFITCMGHSYGLLTAWDILWFINCMGHSYGLLTEWNIPVVY